MLYPNLIFGQKSEPSHDLSKIMIKIVDYINESIFLNTHFTVKDSTGQKIIDSKTGLGKKLYQKIGVGQYYIFLKKGHKYVVTTSELEINSQPCYPEGIEEIDLSKNKDKLEITIRLQDFAVNISFDDINFSPNIPKSTQNEHLQEAILYNHKSIISCHNIIAFLKESNSIIKLKLEGYATPSETNPYELSKRRVLAVKHYLVSHGVNSSRIKIEYFGETIPLVPNDSIINEEINRRVSCSIMYKPCYEQ